MNKTIRAELQFFADGAPEAAELTAAGVSAADAGQLPDAPGAGQDRASARRSWDEIKADYRADFDAEVQAIVQKRIRLMQEKLRAYEQRESEKSMRSRSEERSSALDAAQRRDEAARHLARLCAEAETLRERHPDFDLFSELQSDAFAEMTRPGSAISLEQAFYALHPELRLWEAGAVARRAAEAVAEAVRSGAARPRENTAESPAAPSLSHRDMSREQRQELRRRIYAAAAQGGHLGAEY